MSESLRIGVLLPAPIALFGPGNGIRASAVKLVEAYRRLGHEVFELEPWNLVELESLDVVQFFQGGPGCSGIEHVRRKIKRLVWSPVIDTDQSISKYRLSAQIGSKSVALMTVPGLFRRQGLLSDAVFARSEHERRIVVDALGVDEAKVHVVRLGVDPPQPASPDFARAKFDLPERFALHVSKFTQPRKNVVRLAEATTALGIPLVLAGTGDPGQTLDRIKELSKGGDKIKMLGFVTEEELRSLYAAARIFCLPSIREGVGLVGLEAASYSTGVVVTELGGPPEYYPPEAYLVNPTDPNDIAAKLRAAWDKPNGEALREHVLNDLTWRNTAERSVELFRA